MAAQVNSILKNKKSKVTRKGKAATNKKPVKDDFLTIKTQQYGGSNLLSNHYAKLVDDMSRSMNTYYGERIPDDLESQVKFWKEKCERADKQSDKHLAQVVMLERIISSALTRSCSGSC
jgi:hypothetical protein